MCKEYSMKKIKKIAFVSAFALICAGGLFASGKKDVEEAAKESTEAVKEAVKDSAETVKDSAKDAVNDTVKSAKDAAKEGVKKAADAAENIIDPK